MGYMKKKKNVPKEYWVRIRNQRDFSMVGYVVKVGKGPLRCARYRKDATPYSTRLDAERDILALIDKLRSKRLIADVAAK